MNSIDSFNKKSALWKVSGNSKILNNEHSQLNPNFQLPERFSPAKGGQQKSRLFNSSKDKIKLSTMPADNEGERSSKKMSIGPQIFSSTQLIKQTLELQSPGLQRSPKSRKTTMVRNQSASFMSEEQIRMIKMQAKRQLMHEYQNNRQLIHHLKEEFNRFKVLALAEIHNQKLMIVQMMEQVSRKFEQERSNNASKIMELQKQAYKRAEQIAFAPEISQQIKKIDRIEAVNQTPQTIKNYNAIQLSNETPKKEQKIEPMATLSQPLKHQQFQSQQIEIKEQFKIKENECVQNQMPIETVQESVEPEQKKEVVQVSPPKLINPSVFKKQSPNIQKCNQIVETINILNEINDSPIDRPKSVEKMTLQDYKQKILSITKSNDNLFKTKLKEKEATQEQLKLKGNFKLDKFYSAIQKLKEEVNEIKNISELKTTKNKRMIKNYE